jgi:hypothetical protein
MRTVVTVMLAVGGLASAALAQPPSSTSPTTSPMSRAGVPPKEAGGKKPTNEALASCLSQWEKSTHMSRQEWGRACRRVADRLQNLQVK